MDSVELPDACWRLLEALDIAGTGWPIEMQGLDAVSVSELIELGVYSGDAQFVCENRGLLKAEFHEGKLFLRLTGRGLDALALHRLRSKSASDTDDPSKMADGDYEELLEWVTDNLKGKQRRAVELLIKHRGRIKISDLATDAAINWKKPWDDALKSLVGELRNKLGKLGWRVFRHDNEARLEQKRGGKSGSRITYP